MVFHTLTRECACRLSYMLGVQPIASLHPSSIASCPGAAVVLLNGEVLGAHLQPRVFVQRFRLARRSGLLSEFASIVLLGDCVQISVDGGRLCRPLVLCRGGRPLLSQQHVQVRTHMHARLPGCHACTPLRVHMLHLLEVEHVCCSCVG
jgi:DNA-directed RNA polymerase beta subunit